MATFGSETPGRGTRANQEETSPFPLELMLAAARAAQHQDETAPFPLEFEVVSRRARRNQDETAPFPLEFMVMRPDGGVALVRTAPAVRSRAAAASGVHSRAVGSRASDADFTAQPGATALPELKWCGIDASAELREYAARVASGEELPPFRGPILASPILASGEFPREVRESAPRGEMASDSKAFLKLALAALVMSAVLIAAAVLGDDAELRAAGEAVGRWLQGPERSLSTFPLVEPTHGSANAPCEPLAPLP
jgi:hypothetical protein